MSVLTRRIHGCQYFLKYFSLYRLVVGAPLAESATLGHKTGAVFTCEVLKDDCNEIPGLSDQSKDANGTGSINIFFVVVVVVG